MATFYEYKCKGCGYTVKANPKGKDMVMMGENPKTGKCPKCGGNLEKTDVVLMVD